MAGRQRVFEKHAMNTDQSELSESDKETWNQLWANLHQSHYSAFFDELYAESTVRSWRAFDAASRFLQLLTASSSAIAGWALWQQEGYRDLWIFLAGAAAVIALKDDTIVFSEFKKLRLELERLKSKMQMKAYDGLSDYKKEYFAILERFGTASALKKPDSILSFLFGKRSEKIQSELNRILGYEQ
jgi:hypothetical protein